MQTTAALETRVSIHRPKDQVGVETMMAHYVRHAFKPHAHDDYVIGLIEGGIHDVWCRGEQRHAGPGTVVTMNPGDVHHGGAGVSFGWVQRMIYVTEATMREVLDGMSEGTTCNLPAFEAPFRAEDGAAKNLAAAHDAMHHPGLRLERDVLFHDLIATLVSRFASRPLRPFRDIGPARLVRAKDYLQAHIGEDVPLARLSAILGLRDRQTINLFNRHLGLPPHAYHVILKINALKLCLRGGTPLAECAAAFGFVDQSHMTRHFRAIVGMTPKAYAAAC